MPKISIIMPIYNSEKTLNNTISSVMNQSFKDFELILINDGSTDESELICKEFTTKYNNIIYKKIKNNGVSNARNVGIEIATGDYVSFIDSDDTYEKDTLENLYNAINIDKADLVIAGYKRINITNNKIVVKSIENNTYSKKEFNKIIEKSQSNNLFNQLWNKIYKLEIIKHNKILFDTSLSLGEDYKFNLEYIKSINYIVSSDKIVYNYINSDSGLNTKYRKNRLDINMHNMEILEKIYKEEKYNLDYINKKYIITLISGLKNICQNPNKKEIRKDLKSFVENNKFKEKISNNVNLKYKIMASVLKIKNITLLKLIGSILCFVEKIYKKVKLGY